MEQALEEKEMLEEELLAVPEKEPEPQLQEQMDYLAKKIAELEEKEKVKSPIAAPIAPLV